jgi:hypothetical protein
MKMSFGCLVLVAALCVFVSVAHADQFVTPPLNHQITISNPDSPPLPPAPPYPVPQPQVAAPVFSDTTGAYQCSIGNAISAGTKYKAFIRKYGAGQPDPYRIPAWSRDLLDPKIPLKPAKKGFVSVLVALSSDNRVIDTLVECSTDPEVDASVVAAIRASTFHSAMKDGSSVSSLERVQYWISWR